ncbi:MAG TPA: antitoxin Xre-like helix-turn-helix domain-containing protein [Castellaniella sp.]|uniref:type II RES/Xre toxin-antitoxin system antitoxin n=1 Tax=Castellaniella sp. TaxID=1955812 RepID=UPI002F224C53
MSSLPRYVPEVQAEADFWQSVGIPPRGQKLYAALAEGLPAGVYGRLAASIGLGRQALAVSLGIAPATLQRRLKSGRFNRDESDRLYRLSQIFGRTLELFEGDAPAARRWLCGAVRGLGGARPVDMVSTSAQTNAVLDLIGRLEHGVFA